MRIEKITENKIRVTLSLDDMRSMQLDIEKLSSNAPEARDFFWNVIRKAESDLNFDVKDSQLLVEATVKGDGSVIHISKLNSYADEYEKIARTRVKRVEVRVRRKQQSDSRILAFFFDKIDDVIDVSKELRGYIFTQSSLYKYNKQYCLYRHAETMDKAITSLLSEFGLQIEKPDLFLGKIQEHGEVVIAQNAIESLANI